MVAVLERSENRATNDLAPEIAVSCRGVTKQFGSGNTATMALRGVDLTVYSGQLTLLVGPSGCGKTTLISIVAGLLNPTEGDISVFGAELPKLAGHQLVDFRARNVGFVFQQYNLLPALTAAENAAVPLIIRGTSRRHGVAKARELLDAVGIGDKAEAFPAQLSGGQQQRVAIARALINSPKLLVCDEPTAALDGTAGQTVMRLIKQVAVEPGRAVIVVTHDSRIYGLEDRIVEMSDGRIVRIDENRRGLSPFVAGTTAEVVAEQKGTVPLSEGGSQIGSDRADRRPPPPQFHIRREVHGENRRGLSPFEESSEQKGTVPLSEDGSQNKVLVSGGAL